MYENVIEYSYDSEQYIGRHFGQDGTSDRTVLRTGRCIGQNGASARTVHRLGRCFGQNGTSDRTVLWTALQVGSTD